MGEEQSKEIVEKHENDTWIKENSKYTIEEIKDW